jgi:hypothetical protein
LKKAGRPLPEIADLDALNEDPTYLEEVERRTVVVMATAEEDARPSAVVGLPAVDVWTGVEVAVLGAQLVIATYLDTDEAPDDLIVGTAMIARDLKD